MDICTDDMLNILKCMEEVDIGGFIHRCSMARVLPGASMEVPVFLQLCTKGESNQCFRLTCLSSSQTRTESVPG